MHTKSARQHKPAHAKKIVKKVSKKSIKKSLATTSKRSMGGHAQLDAQGRELPLDYNNTHYHDPYDYLTPGKSLVFDENPGIKAKFASKIFGEGATELDMEDDKNWESQEVEAGRKYMVNLIEDFRTQVHAHGATITNEEEKEAYQNTFVHFANPKPVTDEETKKLLQDMGHCTDLEAFHRNTTATSWSDFFTYDLKYVSPQQKMIYIASSALMYSCAAWLAFEAIDATQQYFYDVEHASAHH